MTHEDAPEESVRDVIPASVTARRWNEQDLQESVLALSKLATGQLSLEDSLKRIAEYAVRAIPGAEGAGLTMLEENRRDTIVCTEPFVAEVDKIQYSLGQGPCISAADTAQTVMAGSLGGDQRWPRFGSRVARLGVHSALSLPLITSEGVLGAMNIYAHGKHVFDEQAASVGELFAVPAAIAVQNAMVLAQTKRLAAHLQDSLDSRMVIDRAVGVLISRSGITEQEALARLQLLGQSERRKLRVVAQGIVDEAARRARAVRRPAPPAEDSHDRHDTADSDDGAAR